MTTAHPNEGIQLRMSEAAAIGATIMEFTADEGRFWSVECPCPEGNLHTVLVSEDDVHEESVTQIKDSCPSLGGLW